MKKIQTWVLALLVFSLTLGLLAGCVAIEDPSINGTTTGGDVAAEGSYKFTVIYGDTREPVEGVTIQLVGEGFKTVTTDQNGVAQYPLGDHEYGTYEIHILTNDDGYFIPTGYSFDNTAFKTNATDKEYTLELVRDVCEHEFDKDLYCAKCQQYQYTVKLRYGAQIKDESKQSKPVEGVHVVITANGTQLIAEGTTNAEGDFVFAAPKFASSDGYSSYQIAIENGVPKGYYVFNDLMFMVGQQECLVECYTQVEKADYTAFNPLKVAINGSGKIVMDAQRFDDSTGDDDLMASVQDDSLYYFSVTPSMPSHVGHYKVTISNVPEGVRIFLGQYPSTAVTVSPSPSKSAISEPGQDVELEFNMEERYLKDSTGAWTYNNSFLFGVRVEGDATYPLECDVTVVRERDLIPGVDYVQNIRTQITIEADAKPAAEIMGDVSDKTLVMIGKDAAAGIDLVLGEDGYYHIGSASGAILLMNLKNANPFFGEGDGQSFVTVNQASGTENLLVSYDRDGYSEVHLYSGMIQAYGALCGADGYYPVNEQLYTFLKDWTSQRVGDLFKGGLDEDHAFLLVCGYYE